MARTPPDGTGRDAVQQGLLPTFCQFTLIVRRNNELFIALGSKETLKVKHMFLISIVFFFLD